MHSRTLETTLVELRDLLRSHHEDRYADLLDELRSIEDDREFSAAITDMQIWGGAGSLVDVSFPDRSQERRFNELVLELAEALAQMRKDTPRTRWVAQIIEDWLISHPTQ